MPKFLEQKLKREYPNNPSAVYATLNSIGAMRGNKETAKGRTMQKKHDAKVSHMASGGMVGYSKGGVITAAKRKSLPASSFGMPSQRKYPMDTRGRAVNAKCRATQQVKKGNLSPATAAHIKAKANRVLGEKKMASGGVVRSMHPNSLKNLTAPKFTKKK